MLHVASDGLELEGGYRLQVLRGSISGFRMHWPGWKQQGWTITEAELPGHIELRTMDEGGDADVIRLEFPEPVKDKEPVELRFRARRSSITSPAPHFADGPRSRIVWPRSHVVGRRRGRQPRSRPAQRRSDAVTPGRRSRSEGFRP